MPHLYLEYYETKIEYDGSKVVGSLFQILGAATEKTRLPRCSFVTGTRSGGDVDDHLSHLGNRMFDRCRIPAKQGD